MVCFEPVTYHLRGCRHHLKVSPLAALTLACTEFLSYLIKVQFLSTIKNEAHLTFQSIKNWVRQVHKYNAMIILDGQRARVVHVVHTTGAIMKFSDNAVPTNATKPVTNAPLALLKTSEWNHSPSASTIDREARHLVSREHFPAVKVFCILEIPTPLNII